MEPDFRPEIYIHAKLQPPTVGTYDLVGLLGIALALAGIALALLGTQDWKAGALLLAIVGVLVVGMQRTLHQLAYSPLPDVLGDRKELRGACEVRGDEEPDDIVRSLYQFSSYGTSKTTWPILGIFSIIGAVVLGCVLAPETSWARASLISFVTLLLTAFFADAFYYAHGELQAQMYRDSLYCQYCALRSFRAAKERSIKTH
jgi:hypothetical protein